MDGEGRNIVVIEFFSETPIDNMISTLTSHPDKVILVGQSKIIRKNGKAYEKFLASVGNDTTQIDYCSVIPHDLGNIVTALEKIVMDYPDCHFDLTGGDELAMAAIGIVYERHKDKGIKLHQYNIRTGVVYDCDMDGRVFSSEIPSLTVEQNIILHGGSIVTDTQRQAVPIRGFWMKNLPQMCLPCGKFAEEIVPCGIIRLPCWQK